MVRLIVISITGDNVKLIDIHGQRFGRLTVLGKSQTSQNGGSLWICRCDCGAEVIKNASNLRNGSTKSCGCLRSDASRAMGANKEHIAKRSAKITQHGHKRRSAMSPEYRTWLGMKRRCQDAKYKDFPNWGGRGIKVCERWDSSFESFLADMGPRPSADHSIDRIDPSGHYEPGNCRWATSVEQGGEHRRDLLIIEVQGQRFESLKAACAHFNMPYTTVHLRIKSGIPVQQALGTPVRKLPNRRSRESYLRRDQRR